MAQSIREVMTADPRTVESSAGVVDAARQMAEGDVGAVLVTEQGRVSGIVTDRDIAVRAVAEARDPQSTKVSDICTRDPATLTVDQSVEDAIRIVREQNVRRIPSCRTGGRRASSPSATWRCSTTWGRRWPT